ncbi:MAG TPA: ATP-binding protein [Geobacteraceae bacterium]
MTDSRILVVEDDDVVADYLKLCLLLMGHTVVGICSYGDEAVEKALELQPDLILMDIKLRGDMSGLDAAAIIRSTNDIPVVYLTAYGDDVILHSAKVTDPFGYLLKPFKENELRTVIEIAMTRHRMEKALKEREASYRILAENLPGLVCRVYLDRTTPMLFFNNMLEKMTGFKEEELTLGTYCLIESLVLPDDKQAVHAVVSNAIAENKPFEVEYRIRHKDGTIRYFLKRGRAITPKDGKSSFIDCVILDITERRAAEENLELAYLKLMERQSFIESILTNIQSGIIVTDLDFRIMLMNPSAEKFLGVSADVVTGNSLHMVCPTFAEALRGDESIDECYCNVCAREHIIGFKMFDLKGKDGAVSGHIISFADLTEIMKIRKEMKVKERLATLGEFVARVAHEIRNPLFGMTAICQIFSMELQLGDEHKKLMNSMMKEAHRLKQIVEELLDCSRELKIVRKKTDLVALFDDTLFENAVFMEQKHVTIERDMPAGELHADVDQAKLKQVIINLLKNAVEASDKHGVIRISMAKDEENVTFAISDSGRGIPADIYDKIFDVFYTTKRHGTGLGLAISKNIVVAHGGTLLARNRQEGGATFVCSLPVYT